MTDKKRGFGRACSQGSRFRSTVRGAACAAAFALLTAGCGGEGPAPSGEPDTVTESSAITQDNFCLNGTVPAAMNALKKAKGRIVKQLGNSGAGNDFVFLNDHVRSGCHLQGLVTLGSFGMVADFNRVTGDNTVIAEVFGTGCPEFPSSFSRAKLMLNPFGFGFTSSIEIPHTSSVFHPSGMAAVGKLVFVAVDDGKSGGSPYLYVYDYSSNATPTLLQTLPLVALGAVDSLAANYDPATQTYHVILNQNSQNRVVALMSVGSPSKFHLAQRLTVDNGRYPGKRKSEFNYQGMSLIRQCDGTMYLAGLTVNKYPSCSGNFDSCDDSIIDYALYNQNDPIVSPWSSTGALDNPCNGFLDFDICPNFAAGATAYVNDSHKLTAIATEHWPEGGDLDTLVWTQP
jgi:hypothetical protein